MARWRRFTTSGWIAPAIIAVVPGHGELTGFDDEGVPTADILIETLTAADGSGTLTIRCEQTLKQIRPNVFRGTDKWEAIGGTGQFTGTEGSGTGMTNVDLNVGTFTKKLNGKIILPNGD